MISRRELCQAVALATHATEFLTQSVEPNYELLIRHFAFGTLHDLTFERQSSTGSSLIACTTQAFMRRLRSEESGPVRLMLGAVRSPKHDDAMWGILTDTEVGLYVWNPRWRSRSFSPNDSTPHSVRYLGSRITRWQVSEFRPLQEVSERLLILLAQHKLSIMPSGIECPCPNDASESIRVGVDVALAAADWCSKNSQHTASSAVWPLALSVLESASVEYGNYRLLRTPVG